MSSRLLMPPEANVEEVLRAYLKHKGQWWWLLVSEIEGTYRVCSFGSLLPYLTGRTPHIVHNIGEGPRMEDVLFAYSITGHFRYLPQVAE